jgi:hypothetical protein
MSATVNHWPETRLDAPLPAFHRWDCEATNEGIAMEEVQDVERRHIVLLRFDPADRAPATKLAVETIEAMSKGDYRLAFSSEKGETLGVFMKSRKVAAVIRAALQKQYAKGTRTFIMVIELGDDWSAFGNSRGWEWLQHH